MSDDELRDEFGARLNAALNLRSRADVPTVPALTVQRRAHRQRSRRRVLAGALTIALLAGATQILVGRTRSTIRVRTINPSGHTTNPAPLSTTSTSQPSTSTSTTGDSRPRNLPVNDSVRAALVTAFAAGQHIDRSYVANTVGRVYYAYDPGTRAYWALANFSASDAARRAHARLQGTPNDPYIQFQDGPIVFSRTERSAWKLVTDTGGLVCPPLLPAPVIASWGVGGGKNCP